MTDSHFSLVFSPSRRVLLLLLLIPLYFFPYSPFIIYSGSRNDGMEWTRDGSSGGV
jgi:hypothetical protein